METRQSKLLEKSTNKTVANLMNVTEPVFRTAYYIAKSNRPFTDHEDLIKLQKLNGVNLGTILHSHFTATAIIHHIAAQMRKKIVEKLVSSTAKIAVLIDESSTQGKKSVLTVHLKADIGNGEPVFIFLNLVELEAQTSEAMTNAFLKCLKTSGFTDEYLQDNWIVFVSDGASVMLGTQSGVATRLCESYPNLFSWHCLNHRLELAVADAIEEVTAINHFRIFMDSIYSLYSQSNKNQRELSEVCYDFGMQCLRIGRVLNVRWVASSFRTVRAVWKSFRALCKHFQTAAGDTKCDGRDCNKYRELYERLRSTEFLCDLGLLYDVLQELSALSLELQKQSMTLPQCETLIKRTIRVLGSFKDEPGDKLNEALKAKESGNFSSVVLKSNTKIKSINRSQFLQSLINNMNKRISSSFPNNATVLEDLKVLDKTMWLGEKNIRFGEKEVSRLARRFRLDEQQAIRGMRAFVEGESEPENLKPLLVAIKTIPCSTAECERDFSLMNIIVTDLRATLSTNNISNLMFVNINGPPLELWNPKEYVKSWLMKPQSAINKQSRVVQEKAVHDDDRYALWQLL
ncbi:E3 SUMO-protein ligase KIAA1586-like [Latimeria chalumnae]|nr:PREDICTED: uncharacterized protein KIAA1586-like [Latimeria chalumnae]|eukprot:XP_014353043.1 PREDICTED: uncharacterized protein KIAA1586-like [Latimeria chalumnae]